MTTSIDGSEDPTSSVPAIAAGDPPAVTTAQNASDASPDDEIGELPDADPELPKIPDVAEEDAPDTPPSTGKKIAKVVVPMLIGAAVVTVIATAAGDSHAMVKALSAVQPTQVGWALACEMASYTFLGLHLRWLGGPGANVRRLAPFRIALVVFGLGAVMPAAPAEGLVMAGSALKHRRLARRRTVLVLGVSQFFGTAGLYALAAIDAFVVVLSSHDGPLSSRWLLLLGAGGTLVALAVLAMVLTRPGFAELVGLASGRIRHPRHPAPAEERRHHGAAWHEAAMHVVGEPVQAARLAASVLLAWTADGACLYFALSGVGVHVSLDVLLLAYSIGAAACMIPFLPAGLGVVETVTPAMLHFYGVPLESALAGLVVYRVLGTFLPALAGGISLGALRLQKAPSEEPEETAAAAAADAAEAAEARAEGSPSLASRATASVAVGRAEHVAEEAADNAQNAGLSR